MIILQFLFFTLLVGFIVWSRFTFSKRKQGARVVCNLPSLTVPPRGTNPVFGITLKVTSPNYWGSGLKWFYKGRLKDDLLYYQRIQLDLPVDSIPIATIGDWIFGVPEYEGNVRFLPDQGQITIQVSLEAPVEVLTLLKKVFPDQTYVSDGRPHGISVIGNEVDETYLIKGR